VLAGIVGWRRNACTKHRRLLRRQFLINAKRAAAGHVVTHYGTDKYRVSIKNTIASARALDIVARLPERSVTKH
jgi:hypothetical protein